MTKRPSSFDDMESKKTKTGGSSAESPAMIITDPIHDDLRTALNINKALDNIYGVKKLGYCPTKIQLFCERHDLDSDLKSRDLANQAILNELGTLHKDMESLSVSHAHGNEGINTFHLCVTRPGCEYDDFVYYGQLTSLIPTWFDHAAIAAYGDMHSLETKVDSDVRSAREIPASEFEVKPKLLEEIQGIWADRFLPRKVRAVPYKIHLYGPGGHFKSHRDTPETGLVGTFLLGLGDSSTTPGGNFQIANQTLSAKPNSWVAFHPDVPHEITKVEGGHRAVVAFKIFRVDDNEPEVVPALLDSGIKRILDQISRPFGLFTTHQYSIGTTSLNGFDALIASYARSKGTTRMLPVVTKFSGEAFYEGCEKGNENYYESSVYPFSRAHVDILLNKNVDQAQKEIAWLDGLSKIPFYTWDIKKSMEIWEEDFPDGSGYIGNEADSSREDSVYLSYAILFL